MFDRAADRESRTTKTCLLNVATKDPAQLTRSLRIIGFTFVRDSDPIVLTDESLTLLISTSEEPLLGLVYFSSDLKEESARLTAQGIDHERHVDGSIAFRSEEGLPIRFQSLETAPITAIPFMGLHALDEDQIFDSSLYPNANIGIFNTLDLPSSDLETSKSFWERLGFECIEYHNGPYPWGVFSDGMMHIGVHQTDDFRYPAITYSAADMRERVRTLKSGSGLRITAFNGAHRSLHKYQVQIDPACRFFLFSF